MTRKSNPASDGLEELAALYGLSVEEARRLLAGGQEPLDRDSFLSLVLRTQERLRGRPQVDSVIMIRELRGEP